MLPNMFAPWNTCSNIQRRNAALQCRRYLETEDEIKSRRISIMTCKTAKCRFLFSAQLESHLVLTRHVSSLIIHLKNLFSAILTRDTKSLFPKGLGASEEG